MPIKFSCKHCKAKLRMSSRVAGRAFECPQCGAKQRAPTPRAPGSPPSSADLAGVPVAESKALLSPEPSRPGAAPVTQRPKLAVPATPGSPAARAKQPPTPALPFDDDEWDAALNPYEAPREDDRPKPPSYGPAGPDIAPGSMRWTKRGLLMTWLGIWGWVVFGTVARAGELVADPEAEGPGAVALVGGVGLLATGLLSVAGQLLCVTTPAKTGARGLAIGSAASLIICGATFLALVRAAESNPSDAFGLGLIVLVSGASAYVSFLLFVKKLGQFLKHSEVVDGVDKLFVYGVSMIVALLLIPVCFGVATAFPDFAWVLFAVPVIGIGVWIGSWVVCFVYAGTVRKLLESIRD